MKPLHCLIVSIFLLSSISSKALNDTLTIVEVEGKSFLSLIPESPPDQMQWGNFGSVIESYYGVTAFSNGDKEKGRKYQCTELVHRFLTKVYGIPSRIGLGLGHGKDLARNLALSYQSKIGRSDTLGQFSIRLENYANGHSPYPPVVGSIVSMYFNKEKKGYGHVGIIRNISELEDGSLRATLFDQHGFIHKEVGISIQADQIFFSQNENGHWEGQVLSWKYQQHYPVVSWTNPVLNNP